MPNCCGKCDPGIRNLEHQLEGGANTRVICERPSFIVYRSEEALRSPGHYLGLLRTWDSTERRPTLERCVAGVSVNVPNGLDLTLPVPQLHFHVFE